jgi:acyl-CoA synthetase (AMP-forming)/AMP-acid ligase II
MREISDKAARDDLEPGTVPRLLGIAARRFGSALCISDSGRTLTYEALAEETGRATRAIMALGVERGDRVGLWAPNMWEWVVAALAIHSAGGVLVPINTRFKGPEAAYVLSRSRARVLFTVTGFLGTDYVALLRASGQALPDLKHTVLLRGNSAGALSWGEFISRGDVVPPAEGERRADSVTSEDLSDIIFTSGTTGHPKGVMCTHGQTLRAFRSWSDIVGLREGDRYLVVLPFFHSFGYKAGWLACLMKGAAIFPQPVFDVDAVLGRIGTDRITVLPGPPSLYQSILAHPGRSGFDLSTLRLAVTGAAVIPVELIDRMRRELTFRTIVTGYGLTEATGVSTLCRPDDDPQTISLTSGRAIPDVEVIVADDQGREIPRGQPGEVLVRGYTVMKGYFEDPERTAEAINKDGWLLTGDIGVMDARGYLRITDRKKDMFIVGGFNAYPAEIEDALMQHPEIARVAVVGAPDERLGEVGVAFVVRRPGTAPTEETIIAWSRERMANYKVPRRVRFLDELPVNATGKVLKYVLRQKAAGGP